MGPRMANVAAKKGYGDDDGPIKQSSRSGDRTEEAP